ncbi:hypothetical protein H4R33_005757 [Dimargaris cristalligena]|nr:hypothetical protein H4R33_005757 [Dimargaris cristalligena]
MTIAIHCVSGLGRAPLLVTMALVANGMAPATAIELVRRKRRGALTIEQVDYLMGYADRLCPTPAPTPTRADSVLVAFVKASASVGAITIVVIIIVAIVGVVIIAPHATPAVTGHTLRSTHSHWLSAFFVNHFDVRLL